MPASILFAAAQTGVNLLGSFIQADLIEARAAAREQLSTIREEMYRAQTEYRSELQAFERTQEMVQTLSAQRAALAASGVGGGRTARLLQAQVRRQASRAEEAADISFARANIQSELRESMADVRADMAEARATQLRRSAILGATLGFGEDLFKYTQQQEAISGPGTGTGTGESTASQRRLF